MSNRKVQIDGLADAVMEGLMEYNDLAADSVKKAGQSLFLWDRWYPR